MRQYKTVGGALSALERLEDQYTAAAAKMEEAKKTRNAMRRQVLRLLSASRQTKASAGTISVRRDERFFARITDPDTFNKWVAKHSMFGLYQKRLNLAAVGEAMEQFSNVPGIATGTETALSVSRTRT